MKVRIISFTRRGRELSRKVRAAFLEMGMEEGEVLLYTGERGIEEGDCQSLKGDLPTVVKASFHEKDPLIFIGASGICLRSIAPFINDKKADPPVLCLDEKGDFVIPLLSGHVGGANQLARRLAEHLGSQAVIQRQQTLTADSRWMNGQKQRTFFGGIEKPQSEFLWTS